MRPDLIKEWLDRQKKPRRLDPDLRRDLEHGWLLPYLLGVEDVTWGRWNYWAKCQLSFGVLPDEPIPQIDFCALSEATKSGAGAQKMLDRALSSVTNYGSSWMGWSGRENLNYFLDWALFGFGHSGQKTEPKEPLGCEGASMRLYQLFDLTPLLLWPYDHLGDMMAESAMNRGVGFYPTPHTLVDLMVRMTMDENADARTQTVCDPCLGTGRMLLHASNYSLRLYGQDIDLTALKVALFNGYLYAPWMVRPIAWLDRSFDAMREEMSSSEPQARERAREFAEAASENAVAQAPPHIQARLFETELDVQGTAQTAPLLKRTRKALGAQPEQVMPEEQMTLLEV